MKRILVVCIIVFAICGFRMAWQSHANEKSAATWEPITFTLQSGQTENILALRIWDSPARDPKWPQLALLRMSPKAYNELRKDSKRLKAFIDGDKTKKPVFDAPVTITSDCKLTEPEGTPEGDTSLLVIVSHRTSMCSCTALKERAIAQ